MKCWLILCLLLMLPLRAAEIFCYDTPGDTVPDVAVSVGKQQVYGVHTARIAGWLLQILPDATFIHQPWQRCLSHARDGKVSGLLSIGYTAERALWYQFPLRDGKPDPALALYEVPYDIFVRRDSQVQWDGTRFSGLQYGLITIKGYLAEQKLRELKALSPLALDIQHAVELVAKGRIDGFVLPPGSTEQQFRHQPEFAQIRQLDQPLFTLPLYLAFHPGFCQQEAARCQQIWQHLATQRALLEAQSLTPADID